ncbi:hypothetical protein LSUE1_G003660 [Lachnellula suecica]|uniref:Rhodopsin domain-containing protein n=1 Tax=Lachnellula suecica TaxID=602035 RepID=A0A8T9CH19_9HELO|nr:hypothetical protein LSUE1_G003660 [Lachnellula suecica]
MSEFYTGPTNGGVLIGTVVTLCLVTGTLFTWRLAFRFSRRTLGLSDLLLTVALLSWINQIFFKIETGLTKLSIIVVYMGIFRKSGTLTVRISRVLNHALAVVVLTYYTAGSLVSTFQCTPVRKAWNKKIPGSCIDNNEFRLANGYINILTSMWIIALPFPALLQVKQQPKEVLQLMGLISLGVMYGLSFHIPTLRFSQLSTYWANTTPNTVAMIEEFIGIIASTIIVMRPCLHLSFQTVSGHTSTFFSSRKSSGYVWEETGGDRGKGFRQIVRTTEIEMERRNRMVEEGEEMPRERIFGAAI